MKNPTPRDVRNAVFIAVVLTATAVLALLDPSCRRFNPSEKPGPTRSLAPH